MKQWEEQHRSLFWRKSTLKVNDCTSVYWVVFSVVYNSKNFFQNQAAVKGYMPSTFHIYRDIYRQYLWDFFSLDMNDKGETTDYWAFHSNWIFITFNVYRRTEMTPKEQMYNAYLCYVQEEHRKYKMNKLEISAIVSHCGKKAETSLFVWLKEWKFWPKIFFRKLLLASSVFSAFP